MRITRLLMGTLLGAVLALAATPQPAAAEPVLLNPKLSGVTNPTAPPTFQLSPDGSRVVYAAGSDGEARRLWSAPTDGSVAPVAFMLPSFAGRVGAFAISPDGSRVVYLYESSVANDQLELYSAPLEGGAAVKLSGPLPAFATIEDFAISPDGSTVVYRADVYADEEFELFGMPIGGGALLRLNKPPVDGGSVSDEYAFSPNSSRVVYRAELDSDWRTELYVSRLDQSGSQRLNQALTWQAEVERFTIMPNERVLFTAGTVFGGRVELFSAPLFSPPEGLTGGSTQAIGDGVIKLSGDMIFGAAVRSFEYIPQTGQVVYRANAEVLENSNLYRVAATGGPSTQMNEPLGPDRTVRNDWAISPDGQWAVYRADQQVDEVDELFAVPLAGGTPLRLHLNLVDGGTVSEFAVSPDSSRVVYLANQQDELDVELYSTALPTPGSTAPLITANVKLNGPLVDNGDVASFALSPAGDRVVYRADQHTAHVDELYSVAFAGGAVAKLNGQLVDGGNVLAFRFSADGSRVVYRADQETDESFALYAAYEPAPSATLAGPAGQLQAGAHQAKVTLSQPMQLAGVLVTVEMTGDAVAGTDFELPSASTLQGPLTPDSKLVVAFAPGEQARAIPVQVLANPERTAPRTLNMTIVGSAGVTQGNPGSLVLTLAKYEAPSAPPSSPPGSPTVPPAQPGTHRTLLPLAQR